VSVSQLQAIPSIVLAPVKGEIRINANAFLHGNIENGVCLADTNLQIAATLQSGRQMVEATHREAGVESPWHGGNNVAMTSIVPAGISQVWRLEHQ
jgi:hypothetical protein